MILSFRRLALDQTSTNTRLDEALTQILASANLPLSESFYEA